MKKLIAKLNIHTPWFYFEPDESWIDRLNEYKLEVHHFSCGSICNIDINNGGLVIFDFNNDITENQLREYTSIFLYFLSICNGFNCEFKEDVEIDGIKKLNYFTYATEDKTDLPLYKNIKFYEISLFEIKDIFGNILNKLFTMNRLFIQTLLSNYYSMLVYKDFVGNGIFKFRNIIANIESIITLIKEKDYNEYKEKNTKYMNSIAEKLSISSTQIKRHICPKLITLEQKIKDVYNEMQKYGLFLKNECVNDTIKIINTRNFISHIFDDEKKAYLNDKEISKYTSSFQECFRMLFLEFCGVEVSLIKNNFLRNIPIRNKLSKIFN